MKKINMKTLIITSIVCLLPIILGMLVYSELPEQVAIHWGIDNNPNGYFSKQAFVFGMPIMMLALQIFCCVVSDISDKNPEANKKAVTVYKWIIPILTVVLYIITVMIALGSNLDIRKIVMMILGIIFIVLGNYMPKLKADYVMNMKAFWVKNKDENLVKKYSRITGYMLIISGFLCMASVLFKPLVSVIVIILSILATILIYLYVFCKGRK